MLKISQRLLAYRFSAPPVKKTVVEEYSNIIVDPSFFEKRDIFSMIENFFKNRSVLNDI